MTLVHLNPRATLASHSVEETKAAYLAPLPEGTRLDFMVEREVGGRLLRDQTDKTSMLRDELIMPSAHPDAVFFSEWKRDSASGLYLLIGRESGIALTDEDRRWTCTWNSSEFLKDPARGHMTRTDEPSVLYLHSGTRSLPLSAISGISAFSTAFLRDCDNLARDCEAYKAAVRAGSASPARAYESTASAGR